MCEGVSTLFGVAGVIAPGIAPGKLPKDGPVAGARGSLGGVIPGTAGGFVPKRGLGTALESSAAGASVPASGLGIRLNTLGLIPANRLGGVVTAGLVASSAVDFVSGFEAAPLCEKPIQPDVGGGGVTVAPVAREEVGLLLGGVPFVGSSGGVIGLGIIDGGAALAAVWSTDDSNLIKGGVGEGALALPSHCPNGVFGATFFLL